MAKTKQVARNTTGGSQRGVRKQLATRAALKATGSGFRHASCMADVRRFANMGFGSPWYVGTDRTGDRRSHVKIRGRWERGISTADLEEEGFLDLDNYAHGETQEKMWTYAGRNDIE